MAGRHTLGEERDGHHRLGREGGPAALRPVPRAARARAEQQRLLPPADLTQQQVAAAAVGEHEAVAERDELCAPEEPARHPAAHAQLVRRLPRRA
eukprot:2677716-Prymnesium_polylepis.1